VPTLASVADLATYTGQELSDSDPAALLALRSATAIVQAETRQWLFYVEAETVELAGGTYRLVLPERPVVGQPELAGHATSDYVDRGGGILDRRRGIWPATVEVTYSHGYREIPADLVTACLSIAARLYERNDAARAISSETIGSYSVSYARSAVAAGELATDERRLLARYRRTVMAARL
jgi:hypothetical protein